MPAINYINLSLHDALPILSRSVIIPIVSPFLPETSTHPMLCLAISFATSAAVSDSFAVITGLDMISRTRTDSGSVSCTDKAERPGDPASIKSSCEYHDVFRQNVISTIEAGPHSSLVEHGIEHICPDSQRGPPRSLAPSFARLLVAARLWRFGRSHLQPCRIRLPGSGPWDVEYDHCGNRRLFRLRLSGEESSRIRSRGAEGSEQARDDWNGILCYLDDLYDDSAVYRSKSASFLGDSFFSSGTGGVEEIAGDGLFIDDRSVT